MRGCPCSNRASVHLSPNFTPSTLILKKSKQATMNDDNWKEITESPGELWDLPDPSDIFEEPEIVDENNIKDLTDDQLASSIKYDY